MNKASKSANLFTFFLFLYYVVTRNEERYLIIKRKNASLSILLMPVYLMVLQIVIGLITMNMTLIYFTYFYVLLVPGTLIMTTMVRNKAWEKERQERKEQENQRRMEREKLREEAFEKQRKMQEERRKEQERIHAQRRARLEQEKLHLNRELEAAYFRLGVKQGDSFRTVKSSFRSLSKQFHPDMPNGDEKQFILVKEAYELIKKSMRN